MAVVLESSKTKIARRVIEVFEFFAVEGRRATVTDIVRRYQRPQSSTSELLVALMEMGLLYKDPQTRSYAPTPRIAALGLASQPELIGNGKLFSYMDRLAEASRCAVGLFGIVGTHAQVFRWSHRAEPGSLPDSLYVNCGSSAPLSGTGVGWLLLSSLGLNQAGRMLWRLKSEAGEEENFDLQGLKHQVTCAAKCGYATGPSGFSPNANVTAMLLPECIGEHRLALGVTYRADSDVDPNALVETLRHGIDHCVSQNSQSDVPLVRSMAFYEPKVGTQI